MTSNAARAATLVRAIEAAIHGHGDRVPALCTEDVHAWGPAMAVASAAELAVQFERREDAFSRIVLDVAPLDVGGEFACAEWSVTMTHSGRLVLADDMVIDPTGLRITLNGATVAEFRDARICSLRSYWDEVGLLEQLGILCSGDVSPFLRPRSPGRRLRARCRRFAPTP